MMVMGCETVPDAQLSIALRKFLKKSGIPHVLRVPIRMRGLTSSGTVGQCYSNVRNLVDVFGGRRLIGWVYSEAPYEHHISANRKVDGIITYLVGHAVWLNDEGRLSDVTAKSWLLHPTWSKYPQRGAKKPYVHFIPWSDNDLPVAVCEHIEILSFPAGGSNSAEDAAVVSIFGALDGDPRKEIDLAKLDRSFAQKYFVEQSQIQKSKRLLADKVALEVFRERERLIGQFPAASTATGATLATIRGARRTRSPKK